MLSNVKPLEERLASPSFICHECQLIADERSRDFFGVTMYGCANVAVYIPSKEEWEKEILPIYGSNNLYLEAKKTKSLDPQVNPIYFETEPGEKWIAERLLPKLNPNLQAKSILILLPWENACTVPFRLISLGSSSLSWCYDVTLGYVTMSIFDSVISRYFTQRNKVWGVAGPKDLY